MRLHRRDEFVVRRRIPTLVQFILLFVADYAAICVIYLFTDTFSEFAPLLFLLLGALNGMMVLSVQRNRDHALVTEFQNALYAAALSTGSQFCLIARKDGVVLYTDNGFRSMYPQFERARHRTVEDVLSIAQVSKEEIDRVYATLTACSSAQHSLTMRDGDGLAARFVLAVDPIRRPADYLLLRGRPYVESRTA